MANGSTNKESQRGLSAVGDLIGQIIGIPGEVLGEAGAAVADSITPEGKISISTLLNLGGRRDLIKQRRQKQQELLDLEIKEAEQGLLEAPVGRATRLAQIQALPVDVQKRVAAALGPEAAQLGLTPESISEREAAQGRIGEFVTETLGVSPEIGAELTAQDPEASLRAAVGARRTQAARETRQREKNIFDLTKKLTPPQERKEVITTPGATPKLPPTTKTVTVTRPPSLKEIRQAKRKATKIVDSIFDTGPSGSREPREPRRTGGTTPSQDLPVLRRRKNPTRQDLAESGKAKLRSNQLVDQGLSSLDAVMVATSEQQGPAMAFAIPASKAPDGTLRNTNDIVSDTIERLEMVLRLKNQGVSTINAMFPTEQSVGLFAQQLLLNSGLSESEIAGVLPILKAEMQKKGL